MRTPLAVLLGSASMVLFPGCRQTTVAPSPQAAAPAAAAPTPIPREQSRVRTAPEILTLLEAGTYHFETQSRFVGVFEHRYRVLTEQGRESWGMASASWEPAWQERPVIEATVTQPDGTVMTLDPSLVTEQQNDAESAQMVSGEHRLLATLPRLEVGSVVDVRITTRSDRSSLYEGVGFAWSWGADDHDIQESVFTIDVPEAMPTKIKHAGVPIAPEVTRDNGRRRLVFAAHALPRLAPREDYLPDTAVTVPFVVVSTASSWDALAAKYGAQVAPRLDASACSAALAELVPPPTAGTEAQRLALLLEKVRARVRYTGLELGEAAVVPTEPCEVLRRGFGDCKDQAALLVALLKRMGVTAQMALLRTGPGWDVSEELPTLSFFDHAVVYVPGSPSLRPQLWIDPTLGFGRVGELGITSQGRRALLLGEAGGSRLVLTPARESQQNRLEETRRIAVSLFGNGNISEHTEHAGAIERYERAQAASLSDADAKTRLAQYAKETFRAEATQQLERSAPADLGRPFTYDVDALRSGAVVTDTNEGVVAFQPASLFTYLPEVLYEEEPAPGSAAPTGRQSPFALSMPHQVILRYEMRAPQGLAVSETPEPVSIKVGAFTIAGTFERVSPSEVVASFRLDTGVAPLSPAELESLRGQLVKWRASFPLLVHFRNEPLARMASGKEAEGLASLRALIHAHPQEPFYRIWYALGLLRAGFGAEARKEAAAATALVADNAKLWALEAYVLQHNDLGVLHGRGYDRKALLAAIEKAVALAPNDADLHFDYAIYLEHDEDGERYGPHADLEGALREYRKALALDDDATTKSNTAFLLFYMGADADCLETLNALDAASTPQSLEIAVLAASRGAEEAARYAMTTATTDADRLTFVQAAVPLMLARKAYAPAAQLLRRFASGATAFNVHMQAGVLERVRPARDILAAASSAPVKAALQFMSGLMDEDAATLAAVMTQDFRSVTQPQEIRAAAQRGIATARLLMPVQLPLGTFRDFLLSSTKVAPEVEGDATLGYRVEISQQLGATNEKQVVYLAMENGAPKVLGSPDACGAIGARVQRHVERGELAPAKRWIEWLAKDASVPMLKDLVAAPDIEEQRRLRLAAGLIMMTQTETAVAGGTVLQRELEREQRPELRALLVPPVAKGLVAQGRQGQAIDLLEAEHRRSPLQEGGLAWLLDLLLQAEKYDRARSLLKELSARNEPYGRWYESELAGREGAYARGFELALPAAGAQPSPEALNRAAWLGLFAGRPVDELLPQALRSCEVTRFLRPNNLHTLATLYAEAGKLQEARETLLRVALVGGEVSLRDDDWYVQGRLAEQYGLNDVAIAAYCRTDPHPKAGQMSTRYLAERRLKALAAACATKGK